MERLKIICCFTYVYFWAFSQSVLAPAAVVFVVLIDAVMIVLVVMIAIVLVVMIVVVLVVMIVVV